MTLAEDASQVRSGTGPQVMAWLRNLVIGTLSRAEPVNLAAALGHHARDPTPVPGPLGITPGCIWTVRENAKAWVPSTNDMAPGGRLGAMRSGVALGLSPAGRPPPALTTGGPICGPCPGPGSGKRHAGRYV